MPLFIVVPAVSIPAKETHFRGLTARFWSLGGMGQGNSPKAASAAPLPPNAPGKRSGNGRATLHYALPRSKRAKCVSFTVRAEGRRISGQ
jgi:hypothetical protein